MIKLFVTLVLLSFSLGPFDAQATEEAKGGRSLYFEISLWHSLTGKKLKQQVEVQEGSSFKVVTTVADVRWTVSGKVGTLREGVVPVELTIVYYVSERQNETSTSPLELQVDKETGGFGAIHGVMITPSIWTKLRKSTVP